MFVLAYAPGSGVHGIGWLFVVLGFLVDLGSHGGGAKSAKNRHAGTDPYRGPTTDREPVRRTGPQISRSSLNLRWTRGHCHSRSTQARPALPISVAFAGSFSNSATRWAV